LADIDDIRRLVRLQPDFILEQTEGSHVPTHRKPTYRHRILAPVLLVGLTVSGVTFAVHGAQEAVQSLDQPRMTPTAGTSADAEEPARVARPSRTAPTPRLVPKEKPSDKAEAKPKPKPKPSKSPSETPSETTEAPAPAPAQPKTPAVPETKAPEPTAPSTQAATSGSSILGATNAARANAGLQALSVNDCLARMAQQHAERLAAARSLYHQNIGAVASACGMSAAGENVAMNYTGPSDMVGQWMDSSGHRANMLNGGFTLIGIGTARAGDGSWYGVQVFGSK
jgi:uncharacterized protein YkwD